MAGKEPEMQGMNNKQDRPLECPDCLHGLQEYLDGTLAKQESLRFFLHLRDCTPCSEEHDSLRGLFQMLESLPDHEVPADFDEAVLASVPYESYRAMAPLRAERVPVFLEEESLPAFVRAPGVRLAGLGVALLALSANIVTDGVAYLPLVMGLGVLPEAVVRLQGLGRRAVVSVRKAES